MAATQAPNLGIWNGWASGESGWTNQMNENLLKMDFFAQATVLDRDLTAPPGSPVDGAAYIVAASATGAWSGQAGKIAIYRSSLTAWEFYTPKNGWIVGVVDENAAVIYTSTGWVVFGGGGGVGPDLTAIEALTGVGVLRRTGTDTWALETITFGTMASQNASAVAINGGTVNGTAIGTTTPSSGSFTAISSTAGLSDSAPSSAAGWAAIKTVNQSGAGAGAGFEAVGARNDGNSSFYGRIGLAHRRGDGTAINTGGIGAVCFGAQWGTDSAYTPAKILYTASIKALAESSFTAATTMATALAFYTGSSGDDLRAANVNYGTEVMRLTSAGNLGVGVTNPTTHKVEINGRGYASGGFVFPAFTVATVPSAAANTNAGIIVTNAASGRRPYWSNGTDWRDAANVILS